MACAQRHRITFSCVHGWYLFFLIIVNQLSVAVVFVASLDDPFADNGVAVLDELKRLFYEMFIYISSLLAIFSLAFSRAQTLTHTHT